jgi:hypothetical protein
MSDLWLKAKGRKVTEQNKNQKIPKSPRRLCPRNFANRIEKGKV